MDYYQVAKDFAGPLATVIASVTAAGITYRFGSKQTQIALSQAETAKASKEISQSQRDIAYDKLKHDLFDKRYEIYTTAREMIEFIGGDKCTSVHDPKLWAMRRKLDEARFFFPETEATIFSQIDKLVQEYLVGKVEHQHADDDQSERFKAADKMTNVLKVLLKTHEELPNSMQAEIGFAQLTRGRRL